jgi:hypothetical protein
MEEKSDIESQCVSMLERVEGGDSLYEVCRALLESILDSGGSCSVVQEGADPRALIEGLESRLRAKGPEVGSQKGLLQTVERLKLESAKINVLAVKSTRRRGFIYSNLENTEVIGVTVN